jgi:hypothetical protein
LQIQSLLFASGGLSFLLLLRFSKRKNGCLISQKEQNQTAFLVWCKGARTKHVDILPSNTPLILHIMLKSAHYTFFDVKNNRFSMLFRIFASDIRKIVKTY